MSAKNQRHMRVDGNGRRAPALGIDPCSPKPDSEFVSHSLKSLYRNCYNCLAGEQMLLKVSTPVSSGRSRLTQNFLKSVFYPSDPATGQVRFNQTLPNPTISSRTQAKRYLHGRLMSFIHPATSPNLLQDTLTSSGEFQLAWRYKAPLKHRKCLEEDSQILYRHGEANKHIQQEAQNWPK